MDALTGAGGYVPLYRIPREDIASQYGDSAAGESAVPHRDENHITMAAEAAEVAFSRSTLGPDALGAVYAASVTDPFAEHGIAAQVAYRLGATGAVETGDFRGTTRAATDTLAAARNFSAATNSPALVVASDVMPAERGADEEQYQGAGAGALLLSPDIDDPADHLHGLARETTGFVEGHRVHGEMAIPGDKRFEGEYGFGEAVEAVVQRALGQAPNMPTAAIITGVDRRVAEQSIAEFPGDVDLVSTFPAVGYAGTASFYLDIVHALETREPGECVVAINYGAGGVDAAILEVGTMNDDRAGLTVDEQIDSKETVSYARHLDYRERVDYEGLGL